MASAWLIAASWTPTPRSGSPPRTSVAEGEVAFDMFGVELSHRGDECTFETLRDSFRRPGRRVEHLARLVHDLACGTDGTRRRWLTPSAPSSTGSALPSRMIGRS